MKRIGLSQRVEVVAEHHERRDCLDQAWFKFLDQLGYVPVLLPNAVENIETYLAQLGLAGMILTGGNDIGSVPERDRLEAGAIDYALRQDLPVLGVCRGMQMINHHFGGRLEKLEGHVATRHPVSIETASLLPFKQALMEVNSFHHYGILPAGLAKHFQAAAGHADGSIEAFFHQEKPLYGVMWHPEREMPFCATDLDVIRWIFEGKRS